MAERQFRCAIYTRKSSEEGLEQDFNSLHAQREACEAYITSQKHEGWKALPAAYDDGGYSGGSMERPGLQRLLADIVSGLIDVVVVYKVDRLTRSLTDFARIVEVFDKHGASFVSVTQHFNTTTSMGRLTLNVLLSFAQFEREVTGERIRDKIAASKKKGMWMGGFVPIGYEANDRTLVINEVEAETVRTIYQRYLALKSVDALKAELDGMDVRTKLRPGKGARMTGGTRFSRGHLYRILSNPLYIGRIEHKGQVYDGQHEAIIDQETWDAVQATLAQNSHARLVKAHSKNPSLLAGLIVDAKGEKLVATHCVNQGRRYRYYVSPCAIKHRRLAQQGNAPQATAQQRALALRLPAAEIEALVLRMLGAHLRDGGWLLDNVPFPHDTIAERQVLLARAGELAAQLETGDRIARRGLVLALVSEVVVDQAAVEVRIKPESLIAAEDGAARQGRAQAQDPAFIGIRQPVSLRRRGPETRLIVQGDGRGEADPDPVLIKALAQAHRWWRDLLEQRFETVRELAHAYGTGERYVARVMRMVFLSPDLTRAILDGAQPPELTMRQFLIEDVAARWQDQPSWRISPLQGV